MASETKVKAKPPPTSRLTRWGKETRMDWIIRFSWDESGAPAVEYALLLTCIAVALIAAVQAFGTAVQGLFQKVTDQWTSS
jgi:Flp pilus assembly pilin Flp